MNDFQAALLWRIVERFGFGSNPTGNEIRFNDIVTLVQPWYDDERWPFDESILYHELSGIVEEGYLETTNYIYWLTFRALVYKEAWPIIRSMVRTDVSAQFEIQKNEFDRYRKSIAVYQWGGIGLAILISGIALGIVLAR